MSVGGRARARECATWLAPALACIALFACDGSPPPLRRAGHPDCCGVHSRFASAPSAPVVAARDAGARDAALDAPPDPAALQRMRGEYLVRHVSGCMECHTPRLATGLFDESKLLSGVENLADVEPDDDTRGAVHSRNLTPDKKTGLGDWTDAQIKHALQDGIDDEDKPLHWLMPYWIFHGMNAGDVDAIVAYLRSIPKVVHEVPERQPTAVDDHGAYRLPRDRIPDTTLGHDDKDYASARRGHYLATSVAPCMLCHSPEVPGDASVPIDVERVFTGRRRLTPVKLGTVAPPGAPKIESWNLTPHENGIGGWSATDVANALRHGVGKSGLPVCDPMPSYYGGSFLGMSEQDALDLGHYFTTLPPQDSGVIPVCCTACHHETIDDAGRD